jgi:hypothetical protein
MVDAPGNIKASVMVATMTLTDTNFGPAKRPWTSPISLTNNPSTANPNIPALGFAGIAPDYFSTNVFSVNEYAVGNGTGWGTKLIRFQA